MSNFSSPQILSGFSLLYSFLWPWWHLFSLFLLPQPTHLTYPLLSASLGSLLARITDASRSAGSVTETMTVWTTAMRLLSFVVSYHTHTRTHTHTSTDMASKQLPLLLILSQMTSGRLNLTVWWCQNEMRERTLNLNSMCLYILNLCKCEFMMSVCVSVQCLDVENLCLLACPSVVAVQPCSCPRQNKSLSKKNPTKIRWKKIRD